jgi:hypothetical protein
MSDPSRPSASLQSASDEAEFEALTSLVRVLQKLSPEARTRVLGAVVTFLAIPPVRGLSTAHAGALPTGGAQERADVPRFSEDRTPSPKDFLFEKRPQTDVERITCLGYYLTHYRDTPHFKTLDISKLNTEAAQLKLSNAAYAVDNATKAGMLVPASKGAKQLSHLGELYVQALPDRAAARAAIAHVRPKKRGKRSSKPISSQPDDSTSDDS